MKTLLVSFLCAALLPMAYGANTYTLKSSVSGIDFDWSDGSNYVEEPADGPQKGDTIVIPAGVTAIANAAAAALDGTCGKCHINIEEGGVFQVYTPTVNRTKTYVQSISGRGTVLQPVEGKDSSGKAYAFDLEIQNTCVFDGKLVGALNYRVYKTFTLTDADQGGLKGSPLISANARFRMSRLTKNKNSILGSGSFNMNSKSVAEYIGGPDISGEAYSPAVWAGSDCIFDAGAYGGFTYSGKFGQSATPWNLTLTGSNVTESVFAGYKDKSNIGPLSIAKEGSGTWRMKENASNKYGSVVVVREGTLRYDTMAPMGENCSLGLANSLYKFGATTATDANKVDYAILLGGTDASGKPTEGFLQSVVVTGDCITNYDRKVVIETKGGFRSGRSRLTIDGVTAASAGEKTLILDGDANNNDIVSNVSDGPGKLSIEKRGSGSWTLRDPSAISGKIDVRNGQLEILNGKGTKYTWYRLTVKATGFFDDRPYLDTGMTFREYSIEQWKKVKGADPTESDQRVLSCPEFFLFTADGKRCGLFPFQHVDKSVSGNDYKPATQSTNAFPSVCQPGHFASDAPSLVTSGTRMVSGMFEGGANSSVDPSDLNFHYNEWLAAGMGRNLDPNDPSTWVRIVMRLPEADAVPTYFDFLHGYAKDTQHVGKNITRCALEGSVDGLNWDVLGSADLDDFATDVGKPYSGSNVYPSSRTATSGQLAKMYALTPAVPTSSAVLNLSSTVAVASGAKLVCTGPVAISKIVLDGNGMGAILGDASISATGIVEVEPLPAGQVSKTYATGLKDVSGAANLADWTLVVDGRTDRYDYAYDAATGSITVTRRPFVMSIW